MPVADYDFCVITQERFSPDANSHLCPVVGECGHSFTKQGIKNWYKGRKTDDHNRRKSYVPCAYNCARKWVNRLGLPKEEQIHAFKPYNLVPNVALCGAIEAIRKVGADNTKNGNEEFVYCSICKSNYSAADAPAGLQHNPSAPVVGVCGHTFCASCIYDKHQEAIQDSKSDSLKLVRCPQCQAKGAFHSDRLVSNQSLKDALMHWEGIGIDYRDLYRNEKAKCNTLKELHDEEMEVQKDLYKKKNAEYEEMKVLCKREEEAQIKCSELYKKIAAEYDHLKVLHEKEMKAQRDLLGKKATKYKVLYERQIEAQIKNRELYKKLAIEHKDLLKKRAEYDALMVKHKEMGAQIMYKDLYEKKIVEYEDLKVVCNNMRRQSDLHDKDMEAQRDLLKRKTAECESLKVVHKREMEAQAQLIELSSKKEARYNEQKTAEYNAIKPGTNKSRKHRSKKRGDIRSGFVTCSEAERKKLSLLTKKAAMSVLQKDNDGNFVYFKDGVKLDGHGNCNSKKLSPAAYNCWFSCSSKSLDQRWLHGHVMNDKTAEDQRDLRIPLTTPELKDMLDYSTYLHFKHTLKLTDEEIKQKNCYIYLKFVQKLQEKYIGEHTTTTNDYFNTVSVELYYTYRCLSSGERIKKGLRIHSDYKDDPQGGTIRSNTQQHTMLMVSLGDKKTITFSRKKYRTSGSVDRSEISFTPRQKGISMFHLDWLDEMPKKRFGDPEGSYSFWEHRAELDTTKLSSKEDERDLVSISFCIGRATKLVKVNPTTDVIAEEETNQNSWTSLQMDHYKSLMASKQYQQNVEEVNKTVYQQLYQKFVDEGIKISNNCS